MGDQQGLVLQPSGELRFQFVPNQQIPATLSLYNPTPDRMAFKIKTTQPRRYSVRPSAGFIDSGHTVEILLTMLAQADTPVDIDTCKDKFQIQSVLAKQGETEILPEMFGKDRAGVMDTRIKVVLEVKGEEAFPTSMGDDVSQLKRKIEELEKERNTLQDNLRMFEKRSSQAKNNSPKPEIKLIYLLLVAIAAFILGQFI